MDKFNKNPPELEAFYKETMSAFPNVTLRKTFGSLCGYVNGHMANGLFDDYMFLRLNRVHEAELLAIPGSRPFAPMRPDRPMKSYVVVPEEILNSKTLLNEWIVRSIEYAGGLPPKPEKPPKKPAKPRK